MMYSFWFTLNCTIGTATVGLMFVIPTCVRIGTLELELASVTRCWPQFLLSRLPKFVMSACSDRRWPRTDGMVCRMATSIWFRNGCLHELRVRIWPRCELRHGEFTMYCSNAACCCATVAITV